MNQAVFITGGTGFLGSEIVSRLVRTTERDIYVLVRASSEEAAVCRLRSVWHYSQDLLQAIGKRVFPVTGDFTKAGLALSPSSAAAVQDRCSLVFHCGAEIGFQKDARDLRLTNSRGTENVLDFAAGLPRLKRFVHISTAYVAGQNKGLIMEDAPAGTAFSSLYEKSKEEAEALVRASGLPFSICRPGMIIGDSVTGRAKNFNTIYYVLRLMLLGKLRVLPIFPKSRLNLVPVDYVAEAAVDIAASDQAAGRTFHLTCPPSMQPQAGELADYVRLWARRNLGIRLPKPVFLPLHGLKRVGIFHNRKEEDRRKSPVSNMLTLLPYFFSDQVFDRTNTDAVTGKEPPDWRTYIDAVLAFACRSNFMRQDGSTVFEQAAVRRKSSRYPVSFYDVGPDGIRRVSGPEASEQIERIRCALWAAGLRKGDRVALSGINSTDYMMLDQAIGLLGCVSVPLYYTTPAEEVALLLSRSGAGWFFAGDRRIMKQVSRLHSDGMLPPHVRVVSFSAADDDAPAFAIRWEDFMAGGNEPAPVQHPDPDDLATIRYTSGTTGEPKGVMFTFAQLAWMGQVLTGLLPWDERNRSMRYLSFLPLSHVVEGILASYAPYYMLARADFYYLNDFDQLTKALPKVRPSVFFSVPRFYEKLWDQMMSSRAGREWAGMKDGPGRESLAALLRRGALKKAGLDCCRQLIAGSAPMSEKLLRDFRSLGIEIHNAYGQTEAPLITINRLGDNVIPTIGTPLPETEVTAAPDGELLVRGPQVTCGYYGLETDTVKNGLLHTGDLGTIHENGHITLHGRKKEMVVTAYGKNISIPKIEERLKDIPEISEAVLIGENRPYCAALVWLAEKAGSTAGAGSTVGAVGISGDGSTSEDGSTAGAGRKAAEARIAEGIDRMNRNLSHPEQVRRFRIIERPLAISSGELTPNLKIRRSNVLDHFRAEIEGMYQ